MISKTSPAFTLILGLGKTGFSCAHYLQNLGLPFVMIDTRRNPPLLGEFKASFPHIPLYLENFDELLFRQANTCVISPGLDWEEPLVQQALAAGLELIGDIELFARAAKAPIIAITGTNAKGTVVTLVATILKAAHKKVQVGGNIGTPALDLLNQEIPDFYVLEVSSFQLETTSSLKARVSAILNISNDHLDRHKSMALYKNAKQRIYEHCEAAVWNREDSLTFPIYPVSQMTDFGLGVPGENSWGIKEISGETWLCRGEKIFFPIKELAIHGQHNYLNVLAALAICSTLGIKDNFLRQALHSYKGLPHRCEEIAEKEGIRWYNDSKGTNVGATVAAITGLGKTCAGKVILIAGGLGKNADFSPLQAPIQQYVKLVILIGKDAPLLEKALKGCTEIQRMETLENAVEWAHHIARKNDIVLLSPACSSLDMFKNYEERGDIFTRLVQTKLRAIS